MTKDEALRMALEALTYCEALSQSVQQQKIHAINAIKEALAQPVQPVRYNCTVVDDKHPDGIPFKDWVQPVQEPDLTAVYMSGLHDGKKKRPWVGLTDDDWAKIEDMPDTFDQGVAWAAARLTRKNT